MTRKVSLAVLVVGFLVASSFVGTAAFTSASVTRSSNVGVAADNAAIIGLEAGSVEGVSEDSDGKLDIDLGSGYGLNSGSTFDYGDSSTVNSKETYAFIMTNNADSSIEFAVNYNSESDPASSTTNLNFEFYSDDDSPLQDSSGSPIVITEDGSGQSFTLSSAQTVYVVISVDTSGLAGGDSLSGDLEITA